jgi:hypothetical protein
MLKFKDYLLEGGPTTVISVDFTKADLKKPDTRLEANRNLAAVLAQDFVNPYAGWVKSGKVLRNYGLELPRAIFPDLKSGSEVFVVRPFGGAFGATLDGTVTSPNSDDNTEMYFYFTYKIDEHGFYQCTGLIAMEGEVGEIAGGEEEENKIERGDLDPRQRQ